MRLRIILGCLLIGVVALGVAAYQAIRWAEGPVIPTEEHPPSQVVVIPDGSTFQHVAVLLEHERLIKSSSIFVLFGKSQSADRKVHAGEYELNPGMTPAEILSKLLNGQVLLHPLTIPEGLTLTQIADLVSQQGLTDREEFLRLAKDREFIVSLGIKAETLEGYLYPNTYKFPRGIKAREVLVAMVEQLGQEVGPDLLARMQELKMTMHEVLTLASVIEKETGSGGERPEISAVFHNRLKKHIPLQSDPTVIYGLPAFDGNLHKKDLSSPSPYNTYRVQGLPPGPIANPGIQAIRATLYPSDSRSLYFVSRNDGTHQFSATLIEHNKAVEKYQKRPFRQGARSQTFITPGEGALAPKGRVS
ncbi:MAG TPA: endolytic transglycosylase MltG [Nitrospiraceae bacterium]|nr:endolytic transglycosylase MltG [Nitrospiraceae bacterium]